jgi:hypothetical protein
MRFVEAYIAVWVAREEQRRGAVRSAAELPAPEAPSHEGRLPREPEPAPHGLAGRRPRQR